MAENVINQISINYKDYQVIQIGMPNEPKIPNSIDKTGLSKLETIKLIASSSIYIGVDSGFYHAANCYPKVRKKIVLNFNEEKLETLIPMRTDLHDDFVWLEHGIEYFNIYDRDIGITNSYLKI
jgi:ADP-heptose:LPS heptosyltransferase